MTWEDFLQTIEPRARRLGLQQDALELLALGYDALQELADRYDLDSLTRYSDGLAMTQDGVEAYPLPPMFGRLMAPKHLDESGLFLWDGTRDTPLGYEAPERFHRDRRSRATGRPSTVTVIGGSLWLKPIPHATAYTVRGHFMASLAFPTDPGQRIPLDTPHVLISATLARAALDAGLPQTQVYAQEAMREAAVAIGQQAKLRQGFQRLQRMSVH